MILHLELCVLLVNVILSIVFAHALDMMYVFYNKRGYLLTYLLNLIRVVPRVPEQLNIKATTVHMIN